MVSNKTNTHFPAFADGKEKQQHRPVTDPPARNIKEREDDMSKITVEVLQGMFDKLDAKFESKLDKFKVDIKADLATKADIANAKTDIIKWVVTTMIVLFLTGLGSIGTSYFSLHSDIKDLRSDMANNISTLRSEARVDNAEIRKDVKEILVSTHKNK